MPITDAEGLPQQRVAPASDPVPELLEQLVTQHVIACAVCGEVISRFEMFAVWPLAALVAHVNCIGAGRQIGGQS